IIAYILVGIIVGPVGFALVTAHDQIELLAKIGVTVLLFLVGLKLDIQHVKHIGPVALATGLGQLLFTIVIGFFITLLLDKDWMTALYVAIALTFSSTIIVIKLLSDKRELDSLHGRIAIGFLIVQDVAVVIAMMFVSTLKDTGLDDTSIVLEVAIIAAKLLAVAVVVFLLMRYVLPWLMRYVAQSQELLLVFAIAWGVALSSAGQLIGFSMEAGAFIAGFSLASTVYRDAISARLGGIRDFLLLFFFVELGSKLDFSSLSEELVSAVILSLFVLIGNPLIVMAIMGYMGYRKRTGFMAGLTVAQISEFSIIFVAMGITLGHVGQDALGLTTLVGIVTIAVSTYMIIYSQTLYQWFSPYLSWFERRVAFRETETSNQPVNDQEPRVLIVGLGRFGGQVMRHLHRQGIAVMGIDFNPEVVQKYREEGFNVLYGNTEDSE
ncbi:MAG TPA: cation:proton antiporter, partial [Thiotrichales bacterium]|nr:cation:proton antiporter [Thiotrichales bacterium]